MIELHGYVCGNVSLLALLAHVGRNVSDDHQIFAAPDFQYGLAGPQLTTTQIAPINHGERASTGAHTPGPLPLAHFATQIAFEAHLVAQATF
jgi:hypothetical protein